MMKQVSPLLLAAACLSLTSAVGCSRGAGEGGGGAQVSLSPAELAGFEKTDVSGKRGGTVTDASIAGPKTFNVMVAKETSSTGAVATMFDGLIARNPETLEFEPALAETYEPSNNGQTWTFKLRQGLKWSDGQPLTADDVVFTFDCVYDPKVNTSWRELMLIDKKPWTYKKLDERTVQIDLPTPFGPFLDTISSTVILPRHKLEGAKKAGTFNSAWGVDTPVTELVGSGSLVLRKFNTDQSLLYQRNPYYWKLASDGTQLPFLDSAVTLIVPDQNASFLKFKTKETDVAGLRAEDWTEAKRSEADGGHRALNLGPAFGVSYISLNQNPRAKKLLPHKLDWFSKKEFRQAISYALDRKSIIETVLRGKGRPLWSPVSEANKAFYNPSVHKYEHDPAKAKALLAGMGLRDKNGDGYLEDGAGHIVEFNLLTNTGNTQRINMCSIIQDDLKQVGIKMHFTPVEFNSLVTRLESTFDWEAVLLSFTGGLDPHAGKSIWTTPGFLHIWHPQQAKPATEWEAQIDQIFSQGAKTVDQAKRKALYDRFQMIASEQLPLIFLVTPDSLVAVRNRITNTKPTPLGLKWNVEEWYVQ